MNEVYQSDAYIDYAAEQATQTENYFGLGEGSADVADAENETDNSANIAQ
jgi:hypothetical protein